MICLYTILAALALPSAEEAKQPHVGVYQKEEKCILHDFGDREDGDLHGLKVWYGCNLMLCCSYYVSTDSRLHAPPQNVLHAEGMFYGEHDPRYFGYNVAFFDTDENLLACSGGNMREPRKILSGITNSSTDVMPIPKNVHQCIDTYKTAYYESDAPIGTATYDPHHKFVVHYIDGDTGKESRRSWPAWKSDGELKGIPFHIRDGARPLPCNPKEGWKAETVEGKCRLKKKLEDDEFDSEEKLDVTLSAGETLRLKFLGHFFINKHNAIETWVHFKNPSDAKLYGALYIAFFDKYGNLVGSVQERVTTEAHATYPLATVDGKPSPDSKGNCRILWISLPLGLEDSITSYKITLYESEKPFGQN